MDVPLALRRFVPGRMSGKKHGFRAQDLEQGRCGRHALVVAGPRVVQNPREFRCGRRLLLCGIHGFGGVEWSEEKWARQEDFSMGKIPTNG